LIAGFTYTELAVDEETVSFPYVQDEDAPWDNRLDMVKSLEAGKIKLAHSLLNQADRDFFKVTCTKIR